MADGRFGAKRTRPHPLPVTRDPLRKSRLLADGAVAAEVKVTSHGRGKSGSVKKNACVTSWSCPQR